MSPRPGRLVVVLGTGTEVGKTWVSARLLADVRARGLKVAARKPAQSADADDPGPSDADVLAGASGEDSQSVCPSHRRYARTMAPPMAAEFLGLTAFTITDLATEIQWSDGLDLGLVETAGGVLSPAASDGSSLDLARAVAPDEVLLVADAGLGTINAVQLSLTAMRDDAWPIVVYLNRFDPGDDVHVANRAWLTGRDGSDLVVDVRAVVDRFA